MPRRRSNPGPLAPAALAAALLALAPSCAPAAALSVEGGPVVLGRTEAATLLLEVVEGPGDEARPLRAAANVGALSAPERVAPGRYRARYLPPASRFPQVALVAVWREGAQDAGAEFVRLPLHGTTRLVVKARPGRAVVAKVGGAEFGPVTAGATGEAVVGITAPPGVGAAVVTAVGDGPSLAREVALDVPPYSRLAAIALPADRDGRGAARLEVFHDAPPGAEAPAARVKVAASVGEVVLERAAGGRYTFRHVAPAGSEAAEVRFSVELEGDPAARAEATAPLARPAPRALYLAADGPVEAGSGAAATITVVVLGDGGVGLAGREVNIVAGGLPLGPVRDRGAGVYQAQLVAPAVAPERGAVELRAELSRGGAAPLVAVSELPVRGRAGAAGPARPLYLGLRAGWAPAGADGPGARLGLDACMHVFPDGSQARLALGLSLTHGTVEQTVTDPGALPARSSAQFFPLTARAGYDLWSGRRASAGAGLGVTLAVARFSRPLGPAVYGVGAGFLGFLSAALSAGPGQLFADASYGSAPVAAPGFRVETGGLAVELGYRVRVR